jgi:hypothetical protein
MYSDQKFLYTNAPKDGVDASAEVIQEDLADAMVHNDDGDSAVLDVGSDPI